MLSCRQLGLLSGAALFSAFALAPERAHADCSPAGRSLPSNTNVTCTGADTVGSSADTGTTNVTITVEPGATVTRNQGDSEPVLSVYSDSRITNNGSLSSNGNTAAGMAARFGGNTLTNNGTIITSGQDAAGFHLLGTGNSVTNSGMAEAQGVTGNAALIDSVAGESNTLVNTATGTLTSRQSIAVLGLAGNETVDNAGSIVSGSGPAIDLGAGNDRLTMRGGSLQGTGAAVVNLGAGDDTMTVLGGVVMGAVDQGDGNDTFVMNNGTIEGSLDQGAGADSAQINGGTVTGNIQQGGGIDDFRMIGGEIGSLNQGDALDTFFMSGGRIVDFFDDGDYAVMTGGRIGRVNMKLDNNVFDMSGGVIDKNLVTGFGNDTIILSNGTIGGNISVSGGTDSVTVTGGTVGGEVRMSAGNDTFVWDGGGIIYGAIDLGGDDDTATLRDLTNANMGATPQITGGSGTDALTFDNVKTPGVARFDSWETIDLTNDSQLIFDGTLTLGDSGSGTGTLNIDSTSTVYGGDANGAVSAFTAGQFANVVNAGRIDLTNGGNSTSDTFTIHGNYTGHDGEIFLDTVLGADSSASDKLVIDGGTAAGQTGMVIVNAGGTGAPTTQNGIMVIEAANGGTTADGAFALNSRVAAGAYEYYLFKGGVSGGTQDNWYLRSALVAPSGSLEPAPGGAPDPVAPVEQIQPEEPVAEPPPPQSHIPPVPLPTDGTSTTDPVDNSPPVQEGSAPPEAPPPPPEAPPADPPPPPPVPPTTPSAVPIDGALPPTEGATPVIADVVPLYRIEVPTYSVIPPVAHHLALSTLGTFHERRGEQSLFTGGGYLPASWGRIFGQSADMGWSGTVDPSLDGHLYGIQAGQDVFGWESAGGQIDRIGFFFGYAHMDGDIRGQALGWNNLAVGDIKASGTSFGGYWTHIGPEGWYLDGVLMGTWFGGDAASKAGQSVGVGGSAVTASLEGGYPITLGDGWTIEPQGQIIWNHLSLKDGADDFASVSFSGDDVVTGRLGLRLQGRYDAGGTILQPYLKANLWHDFDAQQSVRFDDDPIGTKIGGTSLEVGGGVVAQVSESTGLFATVDYTSNLGGEKTRIWEGNVGVSVKW